MSTVSAKPQPITLPEDFRPAPLEAQIEAVIRSIHQVSEDQRRGRIHPDVAALRRWELKSTLHTLKRFAEQHAAASTAT